MHYNHTTKDGYAPHPDGTIFSSKAPKATKRNLAVTLDRCAACGHHKAIVNLGLGAKHGQKCSKCGEYSE